VTDNGQKELYSSALAQLKGFLSVTRKKWFVGDDIDRAIAYIDEIIKEGKKRDKPNK
jgi:hypothetical protein